MDSLTICGKLKTVPGIVNDCEETTNSVMSQQTLGVSSNSWTDVPLSPIDSGEPLDGPVEPKVFFPCLFENLAS